MRMLSFLSLFLLSFVPFASSQNSSSSSINSTSTSEIRTSITLPPLYACTPSSWVYTAPIGPKYLGLFVSGTNSFIETFALPQVYNERTQGTFVWNCDLPPGLSVAAMFYVIQEGASGTNGHQTTTPDALINAPTSANSGNQCYGQNDPGTQRGILSLASSLDPSFTFTSSRSSATNGANSSVGNGSNGKSSTPVGAIIGGVLGGLALIILLILLLIYLRRKHDQANGGFNDGGSVYSGWTEKTRRDHAMGIGGGNNNVAPPGTYYATDPAGNTILVMGEAPHPSASPPLLTHQHSQHGLNLDSPTPMSPPFSQQQQQQQQQQQRHYQASPIPPAGLGESNVPKMTAPLGTLPEPMGDDDNSTPHRPGLQPRNSVGTGIDSYQTAHSNSNTIRGVFDPQTEREGFFERGGRSNGGGLDNPSSFERVGGAR